MTNTDALAHLFEVDNARNLSREETVNTFVDRQGFWRLLSAKNHIVLGSRGSGKTAIAKMLSHNYLSAHDNERSKKIIKDREYIGIYVSAKLSLTTPEFYADNLKGDNRDQEFIWQLNHAVCEAFIDVVESCLDAYVPDSDERRIQGYKLANEYGRIWGSDAVQLTSFDTLREFMADLSHDKNFRDTKSRILGDDYSSDKSSAVYFYGPLFEPLKRSITILKRKIKFPDNSNWLLCLDEVEWLNERHHKILNTFMRTDSGKLYLKLTTMPYRHYTLDTMAGISINDGHDFEYVYLDRDNWYFNQKFKDSISQFSSRIFSKRVRFAGYSGAKNLRSLLGPSQLLEDKKEDWGGESKYFARLLDHANEATIDRARNLLDVSGRYHDQIVRKIRPAILLRDAVRYSSGRAEMTIYSGASLVVRCSDNNPRILIQIFNKLLLESGGARLDRSQRELDLRSIKSVRKVVQNRVLSDFSGSFLRRVLAEKRGREIFELVSTIGNYMRRHLHEGHIGTDFLSSVIVNFDDEAEFGQLIKEAVGLGYLYPSVNQKDPDRMPLTTGEFHLGLVLTPHFQLLPRKGKAHRLRRILESKSDRLIGRHQQDLFWDDEDS